MTFHVLQVGKPGSPSAGTGIISRHPITDRRHVLGSKSSRETRARSWVGGRILGRPLWAGHAPPPRDPRGMARYIARSRVLPGGLGADWNNAPGWMRRTSTRAYRGSGVLGLLAPRWWRPRLLGTVDIGSDHPAVDVAVRLRGVWRVIRIANCAAVSSPVGAFTRARKALHDPAVLDGVRVRVDVVLYSEVSPVDLDRVAGSLAWD